MMVSLLGTDKDMALNSAMPSMVEMSKYEFP